MAKKLPISKRIKELRLELDLSQKKLGILAGIDEFSASARVNQYEKDKHVPDFSTIQRFAKILKVPACYFYAESDEMALAIKYLGSLSGKVRTKVIDTIIKTK